VYVAESGGSNTIDRVGLPTPGAPGQPALTPGDGTAQLSFTAPIDPGTSSITSYQASVDGGASWQPITTSSGPNGTLTTTLSGLTNATAYSVMVRAVNDSGPGADSPSGSVTPNGPQPTPTPPPNPTPTPPASTSPPSISGTPTVGHTLTVSDGAWSSSPSGYTFQWKRDGVPIPGATGNTYMVQAADQGHSITCTVTASEGTSSSSASSAAVLVPIVKVNACPKPSGRLVGTTLGPISLGVTQAKARRMLPRFDVRSYHTDNFCLSGGQGIRVGYASTRLLGATSRSKLARLNGRIVLALTANPYYALHGVRQGTRLVTAARRLKLGKAIHLGPNDWYVVPGATSNGVLKVRHGVVWELGIANKQLTTGRASQLQLLRNF